MKFAIGATLLLLPSNTAASFTDWFSSSRSPTEATEQGDDSNVLIYLQGGESRADRVPVTASAATNSQFNLVGGSSLNGKGSTDQVVAGGMSRDALPAGSGVITGSRVSGTAGTSDALVTGASGKNWGSGINRVVYPPVMAPVVNCRMDVRMTCTLGSNTGPSCATLANNVRSQGNCQETAVYVIDICNTGTVDMEVTIANIDANGQVMSFLDNLPGNPVPIQRCARIQELLAFDACQTQDFSVLSYVQANPPNGNSCEDQEEILFSSAQLSMQNSRVDLPAPIPRPVPAPVPVPRPVPVPVPVPVPQPRVDSPQDCSIDVVMQCQLSSGAPCQDIRPRNTNCQEQVVYISRVCNIGIVEMTMTVANFDFLGDVESYLFAFANPLQPDECSPEMRQTRTIDACEFGVFNALTFVMATPPNGEVCRDQDVINFNTDALPVPVPVPQPVPQPRPVPQPVPVPVPVPQPVPVPVPVPQPVPQPVPVAVASRQRQDCSVQLNMICRLGNGASCSSITPRNTDCAEQVAYEIEVCNTGVVPMAVDIANFQFLADVKSFVLDFQGAIPNGQCSMKILESRVIDACQFRVINALAFVLAIPPNGEGCRSEKGLTFATDALPAPVDPFPAGPRVDPLAIPPQTIQSPPIIIQQDPPEIIRVGSPPVIVQNPVPPVVVPNLPQVVQDPGRIFGSTGEGGSDSCSGKSKGKSKGKGKGGGKSKGGGGENCGKSKGGKGKGGKGKGKSGRNRASSRSYEILASAGRATSSHMVVAFACAVAASLSVLAGAVF